MKGYQYVCHEVQPEVVEVRSIPTQTPLVPCPLSQAVIPERQAGKSDADEPGAGVGVDDALAHEVGHLHVTTDKAPAKK